jgi:hypothetical protein
MKSSKTLTADDVENLARAHGLEVSAGNRAAIAETMTMLRRGVISKIRQFSMDQPPIVTMDPRWGTRS